MKRVILLLLFVVALATSCDPDWALFTQNEGRAYILLIRLMPILSLEVTLLVAHYIQNTLYLPVIQYVFPPHLGMKDPTTGTKWLKLVGIHSWQQSPKESIPE